MNKLSSLFDTPLKKSSVYALLSLFMAAALWFSPSITAPVLDEQADTYFESTIKQAGIAYGTVRLINASVSVIMESNLQVQPAGVGLSLAVGQVLDPLNDMAERLSDVLVTAMVSLGVQKLIYEISISFVPAALAIVLVLLAGIGFLKQPFFVRLQQLLIRFAFILLIVRLFLPLSAFINQVIYDDFFAEQITAEKSALRDESEDLQGLADFSKPQPVKTKTYGFLSSSIWGETSNYLDEKSVQIKKAFLSKQQYASSLIDHLMTLTYLYVGLFVIQVILLPLALFYALLSLSKLASKNMLGG